MTNKPKNVYEQLERIFKRYGYKDLNPDFINGYLTAIACSPNTIEWHEWFDYLFVDESRKERKWQNSEDSDIAFDMLLGAYDELNDMIMGNNYIPYISKGTENKTHEDTKDWVAGFLYGTTLWDQEILTSDEELMRYVTSLHIYDNNDLMQDAGPEALEKAGKIQKEMYKNKPVEIILKIVMSLYFRAKHNNIEFLYPDLVKALKEITDYDIKPEFVHGYISAVICSPVLMKIDVWIAGLWKNFGKPVYNSIDHEAEFNNALFKLYKNLSSDAYNLNVRVQFTDNEDITEATAVWAEGFIGGLDLWEKDAVMKERFTAEYKIIEYYACKGDVADDFFNGYYESEERINENYPLTNFYNSFFELHASFSYDEHSSEPVKVEPKIKRNDPCPCGSGKKYKKCCGK